MKRAIIAEVGSVHDGSFGNALRLIDACAAVGADIVKFQTHIAEAETLRDAPMPPYFKGEPRYEYFERTAFSEAQWRQLLEHCALRNIGFLSSPFSIEAVELLERVGTPAYKVASGEVSNLPMLERIAQTGKPVLLSSGMSDWAELDAAVKVLKGTPLTVMQCASAYPCPPEAVGLNVLVEMRKRYRVPVGYSDHTFGPAAAIAAAAWGATVIEKHFTFSRGMYGSDAAQAMEPDEFANLVGWIRQAWRMRDGPVNKGDASRYAEMRGVFQKSIVAARPVQKGAIIRPADLACKKPGGGLPPSLLSAVAGSVAASDLPAGHMLGLADYR